MSADIHSEIPNASPILAYGESRTHGAGRRLVVGVIAALVVICVFIGAWSYGHIVGDVPEHIAVLAAVRGGAALPSASPELWKNAVQGSKLPVMIGLAKTDTRWEPFAIVPQSSASSFPFHEPVFSFFSIVSDRKLDRHAQLHLSAFTFVELAAERHDAYLRMFIGEIFPGNDDILSGNIDHGVWETDLRAPATSDGLPATDIAIDMTALPGAETSIRDMLSREGLVWTDDAKDPLRSFGVSWSDTGSRLLTFGFGSQKPSSSTLLSLAASAGIADVEKIALPDSTTLDDLRLPQRFFDQTSSTRWTITTGTELELASSSIRIGDLQIQQKPQERVCDADNVLAHFSSLALQKLENGADFLALASLRTLDVVSKDGRIAFCAQ